MCSIPDSAVPANACTLLLAEDDAAVRAVFCAAADESPLRPRVLTVQNGVEVLRYLEGAEPFADREQFPLPEVLVLDLAMPLMNGFDVLRALRVRYAPRTWRELPVVTMTGVSYPGWKETAYRLGATKYFEKGALWEDWLELVAEAVACVPSDTHSR